MIPVSMPFSHWSHQRSISCRKPICGPGSAKCGIFVRPGADQALLRAAQAREQPRDRVGVAVRPAADRIHRALDGGEILAHRAVLPERVAPLMPQPVLDQERAVLEALEPHLPPALADQRRVRRARGIGEHHRRPGEVIGQQAAAHVVDVVGVAVVGRAQRDDRLQRRRPPRRDLERVEAAPADAHHADRAGAPGLRREPGDHLERVVLLLPGVLVLHQPVGIAVAAHVDPHAGIAVAGEIGMGQLVALDRAVALAIGQILEDRRHRVAARHPPAARSAPPAGSRRRA